MLLRYMIICILCILHLSLVDLNRAFAHDVRDIKIGILLPFSGALSDAAQANLDGHQFAVDEINADGGIASLNGLRMRILIGDTKGDPDIGRKEAERLIKEGAHVLMGAYQSSVTYTTSDVAEELGIPYLITTALADILTNRGFQYIFRVEPKLSQFVESQFDFLEDYGLLGKSTDTTIALLYERTLWGQTSAQLQRLIAHDREYKIAADISYPYDLNDLAEISRSIALKLNEAQPDIVLHTSYLSDSIELARAFKEVGFRPRAILATGAGPKDPRFAGVLGRDADYWLVINEWSKDMKRAGALELNNRFLRRYGYDMNGIAAVCYVATWIAKEALELSASVDPSKLRETIADIELSHGPATILPMGKVMFDSQNNNIAMPIVTQIVNKAHVIVWPYEIASQRAIFGKYFQQ